jgi:hypothetical protein
MAEPRVPTGTICANERFVPLHSGDSTPHHGPSCRSGGCIGARRLGTKSTQYRVNESVTTLRLLRPFLRLLLPLLLLLLIALPFFARFAHRVLFVRFDRKMRCLPSRPAGNLLPLPVLPVLQPVAAAHLLEIRESIRDVCLPRLRTPLSRPLSPNNDERMS